MFSEGSLIWGLSIIVKPLLLQASIILIPTGSIYIFLRHGYRRSSADGNQNLRAFFPAIVVSQIITLLVSVAYVTHNLGWRLYPDFWVGMAFASTQYHFAVLSTAPAIGYLSAIALLRFKQLATWHDLGFSRTEVTILQAVGLVVIGLLTVVLFGVSWTYLTSLPAGGRLVVETINALGSTRGIYYAIFVIMLGPILEEAFFRGILFSALRKSIGVYAGLLVQAIIFSGMHLSLGRFIPLLLFGLVLGFVYHKSGSLIPSMAIHILSSALVVLGIQYGF